MGLSERFWKYLVNFFRFYGLVKSSIGVTKTIGSLDFFRQFFQIPFLGTLPATVPVPMAISCS